MKGLRNKVEEKSRLYLGAAVPVWHGEVSEVGASVDGQWKKRPPRHPGMKEMFEEGFGGGGGGWKVEKKVKEGDE
jgi:hypothetical protein